MLNTTDSSGNTHIQSRNTNFFRSVILHGLTFGVLLILLSVSFLGAAAPPYEVQLEANEETTDHQGAPQGERIEFILDIRNSGLNDDEYNISATDCDWDVTLSITSIELKDGEEDSFEVYVDVPEWANATETVKFTVTAQSVNGGDDVNDTVDLTAECEVVYEVSLNTGEGTHSLYPEHDSDDTKQFNLSIRNEGNTEDTFNFEFSDDDNTQAYKRWFTLPDSIILDAGDIDSVTIEITVPPYSSDSGAISDGKLKNVTIVVYSKGARDNGKEKEGITTDNYLSHVDIKEYKYASFTDVSPSFIEMEPGDTATINVTLKNEGNAKTTYSFAKDGKDGVGQYTDWYDFNQSSIEISPYESVQISILVDPNPDAPPGIHDLYFHAESGGTYETDSEFFRVDIAEIFGGRFISSSNKTSDPGRNVQFSISVRNTGNDAHDFFMDNPQMPEGWANPTWDNDQKSINADSANTFRLTIAIPDDFTKVLAGRHTFEITGRYEDEGGSETNIPGSLIINLTVNVVYGVEVSADEFSGEEREPGETVEYMVKVRNSGNVNETYQISILPAGNPSLENGKQWTRVEGLTPTKQITIPVGETRYLPVIIEIPEFSESNQDAEAGLYGVKIKAESTNESQENDELVFEFEVEEYYNVKIWPDDPERNEIMRKHDTTELMFQLGLANNTRFSATFSQPGAHFVK